jgi:hypothetical protein
MNSPIRANCGFVFEVSNRTSQAMAGCHREHVQGAVGGRPERPCGGGGTGHDERRTPIREGATGQWFDALTARPKRSALALAACRTRTSTARGLGARRWPGGDSVLSDAPGQPATEPPQS